MRVLTDKVAEKAVKDAVAEVWVSRKQALVLGYLARHFGQFVRTESLIEYVYGDDPNGGPVRPETNINIMAMKLKPKIAKVGLAIEANRGTVGGRRLVWAKGAAA